MTEDDCKEAQGYWSIGIQYLHLVESVAKEIINQHNSWIIISDHAQNLDEFRRSTQWADHNLIIPLLFNLYHGLELILKGFLKAVNSLPEKNHKLSALLTDFEQEYIHHNLSMYLRKYIHRHELPSLLSSFCNRNSFTMDEYYQALKYPESTKGRVYQHATLQYQGEKGLEFFKILVRDIYIIRSETISLGNLICKKV